ncbi:voltage-dependent calcium channel subunit alpha-2/delta-1-like [Amphiura filiformis]|uniref:voltage-dependent calcium channel subunit alpha-2/delta-1-like n=1 Tax=Amphiura filiformis TaxID=82378 RepID=UPI003B20E66A
MDLFHAGGGCGIRSSLCWLLVLLSMYILVLPTSCEDFPQMSLVKTWGDAISVDLLKRLNESTEIDFLEKKYEEKGFKVSKIDGQVLVKEVSQKWQGMLEKKMKAVKHIVNVLEDAFASHRYNESIEAEDVKFPNAKNITPEVLPLTLLENFRTEVNTNKSAVQIPTDIYEGDKTILNGIEATHPIDEAFRKNYEEDPQLLWQYFGSADGFYRSFPAAAWVAEDPSKDQYDVRRRGWYIQAASSPKNIMILIDTSGSTYGLTLEIMKVSVSKALDTLGNDDFVNVAYFNRDVHPVSCFEGFVQANLRNKDKLKDAISKLNATGIANFHDALEYAFKEFDNFYNLERNLNQGANCHQAILIFTDGGEDTEKEVFHEYNSPVSTRVFVYNVGSDSMVSPAGVKSMACNNKGFFSNIKSFGAVRLTTLDYVPVLSRPMVLSGEKHFQWSDIYLDALGLGMMTTLTRPVYNKTKPREGEPEQLHKGEQQGKNDTNQQMLGVVGTDITTKNMEETVPKNKPAYNSSYRHSIGPEGYAFGINSNGYILLHPRLKAEEEIERMLGKLGYLSEPPNVDFLEVEFVTDEKLKLRKNMINRNTDAETLRTPVMSRDERYVEFVNMTYSYTNIENTTFSVAIAQPQFGLYEFNHSDREFDKTAMDHVSFFIVALGYFMGDNEHSDDFVLIAPWEFCSGIQEGNATTDQIETKLQMEIKKAEGLKDNVLATFENITYYNLTAGNVTIMIENITVENITIDANNNVTCDNDMVKKLFLDAEITKDLLNRWIETWNKVKKHGVIYQLVATQGGLTRIHPPSVPKTWSDEQIKAIQDPWDQAYYQRALYTNNYVFSVPYNRASDGMKPPVNVTYMANVMASKALRMMGDTVAGVLAVTFDPEEFNSMWIEKTTKIYAGFNKKPSPVNCAISEDNEDKNLFCYILDDGGFIVATNQKQEHVGMFFGEVDGDIMHDMHNQSFYSRIETIDYQAACPRQSTTGGAAPRTINVPTIWDMLNFNYWIFTAAWTFIRHTLFDMFIIGVTDYSMIGAEDVDIPENVSCIKLQKQYYLTEEENQGAQGEIRCMNCTRNWAGSRIAGTNLVLLVTRRGECNGCEEKKLTQEAEEPPPDKVPNPCFIQPYYRRRPSDHCYDFHDNETEICSGSNSIYPSSLVLIFHSFCSLVAVILSRSV